MTRSSAWGNDSSIHYRTLVPFTHRKLLFKTVILVSMLLVQTPSTNAADASGTSSLSRHWSAIWAGQMLEVYSPLRLLLKRFSSLLVIFCVKTKCLLGAINTDGANIFCLRMIEVFCSTKNKQTKKNSSWGHCYDLSLQGQHVRLPPKKTVFPYSIFPSLTYIKQKNKFACVEVGKHF